MKGAKILLESLKKEGVEVIFGYPGGSVLEIYDELFKQHEIKHFLMRHEQGAAHGADGYARATGRVGVCLATSGPGATNLVTGLANAHMDSVPLVALTGQVATPSLGKDAFQEADITGITLPITKHNYLVKSTHEIAQTIKEAFHIARTGRPGPVLIDLPKDVTVLEADFEYPLEVDIPGYKPNCEGHPKQIKEALKLIEKAERPVILAGGGLQLADASKELKKFAEMTQIPVTTTLMALGILPTDHTLSLGMPGMHGTAYANYAIHGADLLIALGMRFDDRITGKLASFCPEAKVIHIDIDPAEIGKCVCVDVPIVGDVKKVLEQLIENLQKDGFKKDSEKITPWLEKIATWKKKFPLRYKKSQKEILPEYVMEVINELTRGEAIIATEVGQNQMWAAQYLHFKHPRHWLTSGGLGTMGYGFPAAIGAQVGQPDQLVIDIAGDGSFQMNLQQLAVVAANKLPVKILILNNRYLGMVRQWQELFYQKRYSHTDLEPGMPDFVKLADAYGIPGFRVEKPEEVKPLLKKVFFEIKEPVIVDLRISREENVFPMVPAGGTLDKMLFE